MTNISFSKLVTLLKRNDITYSTVYVINSNITFIKVFVNGNSVIIDCTGVICKVPTEPEGIKVIYIDEVVDDPNIITYDVDFNSIWITEDFLSFGDMERFYRIKDSNDDSDNVDVPEVREVPEVQEVQDTDTKEVGRVSATSITSNETSKEEVHPLDLIYTSTRIEYENDKDGGASESSMKDLDEDQQIDQRDQHLEQIDEQSADNTVNLEEPNNVIIYSHPYPIVSLKELYQMIKNGTLVSWSEGLKNKIERCIDSFINSQYKNVKEMCKTIPDKIHDNIAILQEKIKTLELNREKALSIEKKGSDLIFDIMDKVSNPIENYNKESIASIITSTKYGNTGMVLKEVVEISQLAIRDIDQELEDARNELLTYIYDTGMFVGRLMK